MEDSRGFPENGLEFDKRHIWHPYTSMGNPLPVYPVVGANGVRLTLADGRELIDGMSSWWAVIHGYNCPELNQALFRQIESLSHVMFGGITHGPAVALAARLTEITPALLETVFFPTPDPWRLKWLSRWQFSSGTPKAGRRSIGC